MHAVDIMERGCKLTEFVLEGNIDKVRTAITDGSINVNESDINGRTVLHVAVARGDTDIVKLLLEAGVDATAADSRGNTPLHWCSNVDTVDLLVAHGAGVRTRNLGGLTPRAMAARRGVGEEVLAHLKCLEIGGADTAAPPPSPWQQSAAHSPDAQQTGGRLRCDKVTMSVLVDFYQDIGPRNMILLLLGLLFLSFYLAYTFIGLPSFEDSRVTVDGPSYKVRI